MAIRLGLMVLALTASARLSAQVQPPELSVEAMRTALVTLAQRSVFPPLTWPLESALVLPGEQQFKASGEVAERRRFSGADLAQALGHLLRSDKASVQFGPGPEAVSVRGTSSDHAQVRSAIQSLERALARRVEVRLQFITSAHQGAKDLPDRLTREQLRLLQPHLEGSVSLGAEGLAGNVISLQSVRKQDFRFDADIEVGMTVSGPNPMTGRLRIGHQWWVRAHSAGQGMWYLDFQGRHSAIPRNEKSALRTIDTGVQARIELARLQSKVLAASALIQDGGGIVLRCFGEDGLLGLLSVREKGDWPKHAKPTSSCAPLSWITPPNYRPRSTEVVAVPTRSGRSTHDPLNHWSDEAKSPLNAELAKAMLPPSLSQKVAGVIADHFLFDSEVQVTAPNAVPVATYAIEVLAGSVHHDLAAKTGHLTPKEISQFTHHIKTTARSGSGFYLGSGTEQTYIRDYDVEINRSTLQGDPVTGLFLSGVAVEGAIQRQGHEATLYGSLFLQRELPSQGTESLTAGKGIRLDLKRAITLKRKTEWSLPLNSWASLGLGAGATKEETSAVLIRLSLLKP